MSETALSTTRQETQLASFYDRVPDPLAFIDQVGKVLWQSGACGCSTEAQGKLMALACISERKSPFEIARHYDLIGGKLSMKSSVMLAELRNRGGSFKWIKDGTDGEAVIELSYKGQTITSKYSMDDANRAKLVRSGGGWEKNPANMLRARATSNGVTMIAPEISGGIYTPEEIEDFDDAPVPATTTAKRGRPKKQEQEQPEGDVIDVEVEQAPKTSTTPTPAKPEPAKTEEAAPASTEPAPFETAKAEAAPSESKKESPAPAKTEPQTESPHPDAVLWAIEELVKQVGMTVKQVEENLRKANPDFTSIRDLPNDKAKVLLANLEQQVERAKAREKSRGN